MADISSKAIWDKRGKDTLGAHVYALVLGVSLTWAVFLVGAGARFSYDWRYSLSLVLFTFICAIAGIVIFNASQKPLISLIGVSILSFFMGLSIGPIIAYYNAEVVLTALALTLFVTAGMVVLGTLFPNVIAKMTGILFVGLLVLLVGYFSASLFALFGLASDRVFGILDWFAVFLFSLYIWWDWARAMKLPKTVDNAIDASGALIVDIVNLFLTMLRIVARSQR